MTTVTLQFPEGVFSELRRSPEEFARELRVAAAIHWYQRGEISHEKAADVAGAGHGPRLWKRRWMLTTAR